MKRLVPSLLLLSVVAVWGWSFVLVKDAVASYGVLSFLAIRYAIAAALLAPFAVRRVSRATLGAGAGIGVALAAGFLLQTFGLRFTTASNSGVITGLFVVFVPIAGRLLFGLRTSWLVWAAIGVSVVGLGMLSGAAPQGLNMGDVLTLGAAAAFGLHVALLDRYAKHHDTAALALGQVGAAALLFALAWPFFEPLARPSPLVWRNILITAVLATAVAYYIQTHVQQRLPAVQVAMIMLLEPPFAALFGYLLAGDRLTGVQLLGAAVMTSAALAVELLPTPSSFDTRRAK